MAHMSRAVTIVVMSSLLKLCWPLIEQQGLCSSIHIKKGKHDRHCYHNQSGLCGITNAPFTCVHQLHQLVTSDKGASCQIQKFKEGCGSLQPAYNSNPSEPLVRIHLYYHNTWMGERGAINLTFPSPAWSDLKFQYKTFSSTHGPSCRQFTLSDVTLPLSDTLVYDCVVFDQPGDTSWDAELVVEEGSGEGGTYVFRVPQNLRINPWKTSIAEWHVFFYLHRHHIDYSSHLPVTVQSAPFHDVSYNVSLVKCLESQNLECGQHVTQKSLFVPDPEKLPSFNDDEWTVFLPLWSNPGIYAVMVQIVSRQCPGIGCHISLSPTFEIETNFLGVWVSIGFGFVLIFFLTILIIFNQRLKTNKDILQKLKEAQPTVLFVYLAENEHYLEFIRMLADFLKTTCHILPLLVDHDVGYQDPNYWTMQHMNSADRILFVVPGDTEGESITPIRNQWRVALSYLSGHHFTTQQLTNKVATLFLPFSGNIPHEILHVRRFKLIQNIASLVTWLHSGTWQDRIFLWQPLIRSSAQNEINYTWYEVKEAVLKVSTRIDRTKTLKSPGNVSLTCIKTYELTTVKDNDSLPSEDSSVTSDEHQLNVSAFDPDIPSIKQLQVAEQESIESVSVESSDEQSSIDDILT